jgi:hypothetical protein
MATVCILETGREVPRSARGCGAGAFGFSTTGGCGRATRGGAGLAAGGAALVEVPALLDKAEAGLEVAGFGLGAGALALATA